MMPACRFLHKERGGINPAYHITTVNSQMSASDFSTTRCGCCDEVGHSTRKCPGLKPPPLGFDKGGTRIPDEEDDCRATFVRSETANKEEASFSHVKKQKSTEINIYITPLKNPRPTKRKRI